MAITRNEVRNYAFMMQCDSNPDIAKWVKENLGSKAEALKLKIDVDELDKGPHLTLLFVGDNGMHDVCHNKEKFSELTADINTIFKQHNVLTPMVVESAEKFGRFKNVIVLKLGQEEAVLKAVNDSLKKLLAEKYGIKASSEFAFSAHVSVARTENSEIPDNLIQDLNKALNSLQNNKLTPQNKFELSRRDGVGLTAPTVIIETFLANSQLAVEEIERQLNELKVLLMEKYQTGKIDIRYDKSIPHAAKIVFEDVYVGKTITKIKENENNQAISFLRTFGESELGFGQSKSVSLADSAMWSGFSSGSTLTMDTQFCHAMIKKLKCDPIQYFERDQALVDITRNPFNSPIKLPKLDISKIQKTESLKSNNV